MAHKHTETLFTSHRAPKTKKKKMKQEKSNNKIEIIYGLQLKS